jgi:hypothetical protein
MMQCNAIHFYSLSFVVVVIVSLSSFCKLNLIKSFSIIPSSSSSSFILFLNHERKMKKHRERERERLSFNHLRST